MYAKQRSAESKPVGEVHVVPTTLFRNRRGPQNRLRPGDLEDAVEFCELEEANLWRLEGVDAMADGHQNPGKCRLWRWGHSEVL